MPRPNLEEASFKLFLTGRVAKERTITLAELKKLTQYTAPAVLECAGNARSFLAPRVPGVQWGRGAIGNAEWSGPRLSDMLKLAGADLSAAYVTANGANNGLAKTPDFIRPGVAANPADVDVIEAMPVKSFITSHSDGQTICAKTHHSAWHCLGWRRAHCKSRNPNRLRRKLAGHPALE